MERIEQIKDLAGKLNCYVNEERVKKLLRFSMLMDEEKEETLEDVETLLAPHLPKLLFSKRPMLSSLTSEEAKGEIIIGNVIQGDKTLHPFGLQTSELTRHVGIYGQTGHGKTSLLYTIIDQLIELKIPFQYYDLKEDGRCLLRQHEDLVVIPWRQLKWNPLRNPPGMDVKSWWQLFAEVCGHAWGVYHAGVNYILEYLDRLYEEQEKVGKFPTLVDLYRLMVDTQETTKKRLEYFDVMYNRVRALVSILGSVIDVETGFKLEELLDDPVVIELDQLRADEQNWIVEVMLTWIYAYRLVQGHRSEKLRHCILVDECHRIFDVNKEYRETTREMGMPTINLFPTQFRDFGESLIVTSQEPSKVTDSIHANTLVKVVGNLGSGKDINAISEAMNLTDEERDCIPNLQRGEWLIKMSDRYTKPFMIATPYHPADKDITDEEVRQRISALLCKSATEPKRQMRQTGEIKQIISKDAWKLLTHVNACPFHGIAGRAKEMGVSMREIESAKGELIDAALVQEVSFSLSAKKPTKFLVPTEKALQLVESQGMNTGLWKHIGNVGFEHVLYQVLIRWEYKKLGYEAYMEAKLENGRRLDILAIKGVRRIGVEVELSPYNDQENKLMGIEFLSELYIVSNSEDNLKIIERKLNELNPAILGNVKLLTVSKFLKALYNIAQNNSGNNSSGQKETEFNRSRNLIGGSEN